MNAVRVFVSLIGCFIYGLTITYVGGIENALSQQFGLTASVMGSLNNIYLFGSVFGLIVCSSMLDGPHAHRLIVVLSFLVTIAFALVGMPENQSYIMFGELLMGFGAISYMTYAVKLSSVYYPKIMHRLLPLIVGFMIFGNAGTSIIENMTLRFGFVETDGVITLSLLFYTLIVWLTAKPLDDVENESPQSPREWFKQMLKVLEPLKSQEFFTVVLSTVSVGFAVVIFFNLITPMVYIHTPYQGTTSLIYLTKAVLGSVLGFIFTEQWSTIRSLTTQYGLICACSLMLLMLFYHEADLFYITVVLCTLAAVVSTNAANTLHNVTKNISYSQSATRAGCLNIVYKAGVFIIGLPMSFMLPHQTIDRIHHKDLLMPAIYFVIISSIVFAMMLHLLFNKDDSNSN